jgi:hypothetical protein
MRPSNYKTLQCCNCNEINDIQINIYPICEKCKFPLLLDDDTQKDLLLKREISLLPSTQLYVHPTSQLRQIKGNIKEIRNQISLLKEQLNELEIDKFNYEKKLCDVSSERFIHPCPYDCRGYINESYQCKLCNNKACPSCFQKAHDEQCINKIEIDKHCSTCKSYICLCDYYYSSLSLPNIDMNMIKSSSPINYTRVAINEIYKKFNYIREVVYPTLDKDDFRHIRIEYLLGDLSQEEFKNKVGLLYKKNKYHIEYKNLIKFYFYNLSNIDIGNYFYNYSEIFIEKESKLKDCINTRIQNLNEKSNILFKLI